MSEETLRSEPGGRCDAFTFGRSRQQQRPGRFTTAGSRFRSVAASARGSVLIALGDSAHVAHYNLQKSLLIFRRGRTDPRTIRSATRTISAGSGTSFKSRDSRKRQNKTRLCPAPVRGGGATCWPFNATAEVFNWQDVTAATESVAGQSRPSAGTRSLGRSEPKFYLNVGIGYPCFGHKIVSIEIHASCSFDTFPPHETT